MSTIRLLDISGCFHPLWRYHESRGSSPGDAAADTVRALRERASAAGADYVVACCDSGKCFRHEIAMEYRAIDPEYKGYKANRKERDAAMIAALERVIDNLEQDGVPIFKAPGFEADDVIATLVAWAIPQGHDVEIVSDDKDLTALVAPAMTLTGDNGPVQFGGVQVVKRSGEVVGPEEVKAAFGVEPYQIPEWLAMVGDVSDHVKGIPGIGDKKASAMLSAYGTWRAIVEAAKKDADYVAECECKLALARENKVRPLPTFEKPRFQNATRAAILANQALFDISVRLTTLRADVPLDFEKVTAERRPPPDPEGEAEMRALLEEGDAEAEAEEAAIAAAAEQMSQRKEEQIEAMSTQQHVIDAEFTEAKPADRPSAPAVTAPPPEPKAEVAAASVVTTPEQPAAPVASTPKPAAAMEPKRDALMVANDGRPFHLQLEPRNPKEADWLARCLFNSRVFKDLGSVEAAYAKLAVGRSMGLTLYQSLSLHMFQGRVVKPAMMIVAQVRQHPQCEFFRKRSGTAESAIWETKKRGDPRVMDWEFTIAEAREAGLVKPDSGWAKYPKNMCSWRAATFLAREEWAEVVGDFLTPEEVEDIRDRGAIDTIGEAA